MQKSLVSKTTRRLLPAFFSVIIAILHGCGGASESKIPFQPPPPPPPATLYASPETSHATGATPEVNVVFRGFAVRGEPIDKSFGFYVYLHFSADGHVGKETRLAASRAYMRLFEHVIEARKIEVPRDHLALLVAPIKTNETPSTEYDLLRDYDYAHSQMIIQLLKDDNLPKVALIGSERPLTAGQEDATAWIIDLCRDPDLVEETILKMRDDLLLNRPSTTVAASSFSILTSMRTFLGNLGAFVRQSIAPKSAHASAACK